MTFLPERDQTTGQATGKWYNDEISTPITEEALREKGFETSGFYYTMLQMRIGRILIYYNTISRFCMLVDGRNEIEIPNCNTVQDLDDLIRILGGNYT